MIPWLDRREAVQRLANMNKAIAELGGDQHAPAQLLGQRDMIEFELEYYEERCDDWRTGGLTFVLMTIVFSFWFFVMDKV